MRPRPVSNRRITVLQTVALTNFATGSGRGPAVLRGAFVILYGSRDFVYFLAIFLTHIDCEVEERDFA